MRICESIISNTTSVDNNFIYAWALPAPNYIPLCQSIKTVTAQAGHYLECALAMLKFNVSELQFILPANR